VLAVWESSSSSRDWRALSPDDSFAQLTQRLDSVAASLDEKLTQTRSDIRDVCSRSRANLSLESAIVYPGGFLSLKTALEHQLSLGGKSWQRRSNWNFRLTAENRISMDAIRSDVDQKLAAISNSVQVKLDPEYQGRFRAIRKSPAASGVKRRSN